MLIAVKCTITKINDVFVLSCLKRSTERTDPGVHILYCRQLSGNGSRADGKSFV